MTATPLLFSDLNLSAPLLAFGGASDGIAPVQCVRPLSSNWARSRRSSPMKKSW